MMIKFCYKYLKKYKCLVIEYFILLLGAGGLTIIVPMITGRIIDYITEHNQKALFGGIKLFVIIQVTLIIFSFIKNKTYIKLQTNTAFSMISDMIIHIQNMEISITENYEMGYLNQRINNDYNSLSSFVIELMGELLVSVLTFFFSAFILISINSILGLLLLVVGFFYIVVYALLKNNLYKVSLKLKEEQAEFFSAMLMQLADIKFIKIHSLIKDYQKKMKNSYKHYFTQVLKSQNLFLVYGSLDSIVTLLANISIFVIGGNLVLNGEMSIGTFTIAISYFNYIVQSFKYFSSLGKSYQDNKASYNRILELMNIEEEKQEGMILENVDSIICQNVGFKRDGKQILANFTQEFTKGNIYCICGNNGVGKSTLINILIGLYPSTYTGKILYNSIDIKKINMQKIRYSKISVMEQDLVLLKGEVKDNILLSSNYSLQNIKFIIEDYKETEGIINSLGKINESKGGVSGGERQKIGMYRAFAKDADVFILDEPTASLDKSSTQYYMQQIVESKKSKIIIIISHDESVMKMCDYIIEL